MDLNVEKAFSLHPRSHRSNRWIYPVLSRRAGGISIGVNLNLDKACNYDCAYCQVDRRPTSPEQEIDCNALEAELLETLAEWHESRFLDKPEFRGISADRLQLRDIALSGDGEPTLVPEFVDICSRLAKIQVGLTNPCPRLVLITNGTLLHTERVQEGVALLCKQDGEVWGKLDAGSDAWHKTIDRSRIPLLRIEENLIMTGRRFPLRIQSMFCQVGKDEPDDNEIEQWAARVSRIAREVGENLRQVQIYTLARHTPAVECFALPQERLQFIRNVLFSVAPQISAEVYG